jgi:hypothetical protein
MAQSAAAVFENVNKQIVQMFFKADGRNEAADIGNRIADRRITHLSGSVAAAFSI